MPKRRHGARIQRRVDNGRQVQGVMALAMAAPVSVDWVRILATGNPIDLRSRVSLGPFDTQG
jgi:hypothetical protein